ncbi:hypothetical protein KIPB_013171, partial [Kipferlia bialata]|eukprot:g13171.t1
MPSSDNDRERDQRPCPLDGLDVTGGAELFNTITSPSTYNVSFDRSALLCSAGLTTEQLQQQLKAIQVRIKAAEAKARNTRYKPTVADTLDQASLYIIGYKLVVERGVNASREDQTHSYKWLRRGVLALDKARQMEGVDAKTLTGIIAKIVKHIPRLQSLAERLGMPIQ